MSPDRDPVAPTVLWDRRIQLHWAAQVAEGVA
jgi:hypothetical protein